MAATALVTGGNRGLGREACRQLAARGYRVLLTSREVASGRAAAGALAAAGLDVTHLALDVADGPSIAALAARGEPLDVLVNNAGVALDGFDAEVARRTLAVNFFGALAVTDALLPRLRDGGNVVMVTSGLGALAALAPARQARFTDPALDRRALVELMQAFVDDVARGEEARAGWPSNAYRVSKIGLNALVHVLARELAPRHIRVNAADPGWARTDMGGPGATRSAEAGAASIVWAAADSDGLNGLILRDGKSVAW
jgi:NAD(P)-dependent dehydrogenase (short-subunit alcohol dehydrogenase family)